MLQIKPDCIKCLLDKHLMLFEDTEAPEKQLEYMEKLLALLSDFPKDKSACEALLYIQKLQYEMFGYKDDYTDIKSYYNQLMLKLVPDIKAQIQSADDPLYTAMQYALFGNYIDFAVLSEVDDNKLLELIGSAESKALDKTEFENLKSDLTKSKRLVYLTDNCGEVVLDRLLIEQIKKLCPDIDVTVIVRGYPIANDATVEDAKEAGLDKLADVVPNGSRIIGTIYSDISDKARELIKSADVILSKGQANFETLGGSPFNVYYLFLCKCDMFSKCFEVPKFTGMLINDKRLKKGLL